MKAKLVLALIVFVACIIYIVYDLNNPISEKQRIYDKAKYAFENEDYETAIEKYDSCIYFAFNEGLAYFYKGISEIKLNKIEEGINDCQQGYSITPELYDKYYALELYKYEDSNYKNTENNSAEIPDEEITDTDTYIDYSDLSVDSLNTLGVTEYNNKDYRKAMFFYNTAIKKDDSRAYLYYNIGLCYEYLDKYDSAIVLLDKAINVDKKYYNAYFELGYSYYKKLDYKKSISFYKKYLKFNPDDESAQVNLALSYYKNGKISKACMLWKKYCQEGNSYAKDYIKDYCKNYYYCE